MADSTSPDHPILSKLLAEAYGVTGRISVLSGENRNFLVAAPDGSRFVLKLNGDQQSTATLQLEHLAVETLARAGLGLELPRFVPTRDGDIEAVHPTGQDVLRGRLLEFVDGTSWLESGPSSSARRRNLGRTLARVSVALSGVDAESVDRTHRWDLAAARAHRPSVALVDEPRRRRMLDRAFTLFVSSALPFLDDLPRSLIHGDLNDENLLVEGDEITGLLDFGDCLVNPTVCELAIGLAYALLDEAEPLAAGAEIVAAYHRLRPLEEREAQVLFPLICARLAVSLVIATERRRIDATRASWFVTEKRAWKALERWLEIDPLRAAEALTAGTALMVFADRSPPRAALERGRRRRFSGALSLTYREPIAFSRGRGQFLFDERERPYLDMYNNVCHVGHCHPHVVEAGARQMRRLNTNTRYLHRQMIDYADRLCALLPEPLDTCFFVNSGSEANELALRLARNHTGRRDVLVVEGAYHGHTHTMIEISPYKFLGRGGTGRPEDWVHVVPIADGYRGEFKGQRRDTGLAYAGQVRERLERLEQENRPPAAFITESLLSCGGQVVPPEGYLEAAFAAVRRAGGVCIADEVQVGFGRVGRHFWGFELSGVVPDIVVLGKPIGNGHPMAAVITSEEIGRSFADAGMEFFTTFGGNPVSCAIGMAVLDVIENEALQRNALEVGTYLRDALQEALERHPLVGDVRGVGLFLGIELVRDRQTLEPAPEETSALVNCLAERGILTGIDGPFRNVIKLKGPMVLDCDDADLFVRAVDAALSEMGEAIETIGRVGEAPLPRQR